MSEDEKFLARWSRRKQEVAKEDAKLDQKSVPGLKQADKIAPKASSEAPAPDLGKLPSLDEITAQTDISGFLQKGVPTDLARAALRRAWTSDPAIRDFVGLQENDWVFNKPGPDQGFGPLGPDTDVGKLLAQVFGEAPQDSPVENDGECADSQRADTSAPAERATAGPSDQPTQTVTSEDDALHKKTAEMSPSRHSHGGALPRPISES